MLDKGNTVKLDDKTLSNIVGGVDDPNCPLYKKGYGYIAENESGIKCHVRILKYIGFQYGHNCYFVECIYVNSKNKSKNIIIIEEDIKNRIFIDESTKVSPGL